MDKIKVLPKTPVLDSDTEKSVRNAFNDTYTKVNQVIKNLLGLKPSDIGAAREIHAVQHKAGGGDALTPADIGAAASSQTAWTIPSLLNGWVRYDSKYADVGYFKDTLGFVHLRGLIKNGAISSTLPIFLLPPGYRPAEQLLFPVLTNPNALGRCDVTNIGEILPFSGSNTWFSLNGISFRAEA